MSKKKSVPYTNKIKASPISKKKKPNLDYEYVFDFYKHKSIKMKKINFTNYLKENQVESCKRSEKILLDFINNPSTTSLKKKPTSFDYNKRNEKAVVVKKILNNINIATTFEEYENFFVIGTVGSSRFIFFERRRKECIVRYVILHDIHHLLFPSPKYNFNDYMSYSYCLSNYKTVLS